MKSETAGKPFDLEHSLISSRDRAAIPVVVYDKAKADGIALEKLGTERLWLALKPIWPDDRPHLPIAEIADWFAAYVYLPKVRDRVVLEGAIRDAVGKARSAVRLCRRLRRSDRQVSQADLGEEPARDSCRQPR